MVLCGANEGVKPSGALGRMAFLMGAHEIAAGFGRGDEGVTTTLARDGSGLLMSEKPGPHANKCDD